MVVVINDNPAAGTMLNYLLAPSHIHIVYASCNLRGIHLIQDLQPELIIIDPHLPNLENGQSVPAALANDPVLARIPILNIPTDDLYVDEESRMRLKQQLQHLFSPSSEEAIAA